ncbi:MAG: hypothetical protein A3F42_02895 [Gammaproteobacteria bacterium RIFCSPHIGHO2_12_FULL_37_34]|nr:MAG: hypothetical protein A3F42_02895 [Gammaproteobacteria bacterium RIFCSPHIGHO2_12_FULL_37_34]
MKIKLLVISSILAATLSYVAPVVADDENSNQAISSSTDNNMNMQLGQDNSTSMSGAGSSTDANAAGTDEGSPDTATGDDDY